MLTSLGQYLEEIFGKIQHNDLFLICFKSMSVCAT